MLLRVFSTPGLLARGGLGSLRGDWDSRMLLVPEMAPEAGREILVVMGVFSC